jgi:hypothetical protein
MPQFTKVATNTTQNCCQDVVSHHKFRHHMCHQQTPINPVLQMLPTSGQMSKLKAARSSEM